MLIVLYLILFLVSNIFPRILFFNSYDFGHSLYGRPPQPACQKENIYCLAGSASGQYFLGKFSGYYGKVGKWLFDEPLPQRCHCQRNLEKPAQK